MFYILFATKMQMFINIHHLYKAIMSKLLWSINFIVNFTNRKGKVLYLIPILFGKILHINVLINF